MTAQDFLCKAPSFEEEIRRSPANLASSEVKEGSCAASPRSCSNNSADLAIRLTVHIQFTGAVDGESRVGTSITRHGCAARQVWSFSSAGLICRLGNRKHGVVDFSVP